MLEKLRQRFCKDKGIKLQIYKSPYFEERIKLFGFEHDYNEFLKLVDSFESIEQFFDYYNQVKDSMIDYIKNSEVFQALNSDDMNKYPKYQIRQSEVYKSNNIGKEFISIDMNKANFSALVKYAKDTGTKFFDSYNYKDFIKQFTEHDYFAESKYIRQVVFGNCNPKRQITYESYLMSDLLRTLIDTNMVLESDIYSMCSDEIIIEVSDTVDVKAIEGYCKTFNDFPISFEKFTLLKLTGTEAYMKYQANDNIVSYSLKKVNPYEAPFIYRFLNKESYKDSDSVFMFEGKLAKLLDTPNILIGTNNHC